MNALEAYQEMFDYSGEQWAAIEKEIALVRSAPLTGFERQLFIGAGTSYLSSVRNSQSFEARDQEVELWTLVRNLTEKLLTALNRTKATYTYDEKFMVQVIPLLSKLRRHAEFFFPTILLSPKEEYYRSVLTLWVDHCGGQLKKTRDKVTQKPKGPLLRFFVAVTYPVMGIDAPKPETIFGIVDREKLRRKAANSR